MKCPQVSTIGTLRNINTSADGAGIASSLSGRPRLPAVRVGDASCRRRRLSAILKPVAAATIVLGAPTGVVERPGAPHARGRSRGVALKRQSELGVAAGRRQGSVTELGSVPAGSGCTAAGTPW